MNKDLTEFPAMQSFDLDAALQRLLGRKDLLQQVMQAFAASSVGADQRLRQHFDQQDHAAAQALAHQIKGSAANMGAMQLSAVAAGIEQQLKQGQTDTPHDRLLQFEHALQLVLSDIARFDSVTTAQKVALLPGQRADLAAMQTCARMIEQFIRTDLGRVQHELRTLTNLASGSEYQDWAAELNVAFDQFKLIDVARLVKTFLANPIEDE